MDENNSQFQQNIETGKKKINTSRSKNSDIAADLKEEESIDNNQGGFRHFLNQHRIEHNINASSGRTHLNPEYQTAKDTQHNNHHQHHIPLSSLDSQTDRKIESRLIKQKEQSQNGRITEQRRRKDYENEESGDTQMRKYSINTGVRSMKNQQEISSNFSKAKLLSNVYQNLTSGSGNQSRITESYHHNSSKDKLMLEDSRNFASSYTSIIMDQNRAIDEKESQRIHIVEEESPTKVKHQTYDSSLTHNNDTDQMISIISQPQIIVHNAISCACLHEFNPNLDHKQTGLPVDSLSLDSRLLNNQTLSLEKKEEQKNNEEDNILNNQYKNGIQKFHLRSLQNREKMSSQVLEKKDSLEEYYLDEDQFRQQTQELQDLIRQRDQPILLDVSESKRISRRSSHHGDSIQQPFLVENQDHNQYVQIFDNLNYAEQSNKTSLSIQQKEQLEEGLNNQIFSFKAIQNDNQEDIPEYDQDGFEDISKNGSHKQSAMKKQEIEHREMLNRSIQCEQQQIYPHQRSDKEIQAQSRQSTYMQQQQQQQSQKQSGSNNHSKTHITTRTKPNQHSHSRQQIIGSNDSKDALNIVSQDYNTDMIFNTNHSKVNTFRQTHNNSKHDEFSHRQKGKSSGRKQKNSESPEKNGKDENNGKDHSNVRIKKLKFQFINNKKKQQIIENQKLSATRINIKLQNSNDKPHVEIDNPKSTRRREKELFLESLSQVRKNTISPTKLYNKKAQQSRMKVMNQINENRAQFYSTFLNQQGEKMNQSYYQTTENQEDEETHRQYMAYQNRKKLQRVAIDTYRNFDLKFSGISKAEIIKSPIEELDKRINENLSKRNIKHRMAQLQNMHQAYQNSRNFTAQGEFHKINMTEGPMSTRPFTNEDATIRYQTPLNYHFSSNSRENDYQPNSNKISSQLTNIHQTLNDRVKSTTNYRRNLPFFESNGGNDHTLSAKNGRLKYNRRNLYQTQQDAQDLDFSSSQYSTLYQQRPYTNMIYQKKHQGTQYGLNSNRKAQSKSHEKQRVNKLINPNLIPKTHLADQLNWSVRGRPVQQLMGIIKGDTGKNEMAANQYLQKISPRHKQDRSISREEVFQQTFQEFNKQYVPYFALEPPEFKTDPKYYYNKRDPIEYQQVNIESWREDSQYSNYPVKKQSTTIDWAETDVYRQTKFEDYLPFNKERSLKYFTLEEIEHLMQMMQERQQDYDRSEILEPIIRKALATLEQLYLPMGQGKKYDRLVEQYSKSNESYTIEQTLGILIRIKMTMGSKKALFGCLRMIRRFESLLREIKSIIDQSLDIQSDEKSRLQNLQNMAWDFFQFSEIVVKNILELKFKHNLYSKQFAFKKKDFVKYIRKELEELRNMLLVFDIELPQQQNINIDYKI